MLQLKQIDETMKEKILALLTAKFPGVRKDGLTQLARSLALQCATEEDAKGIVDKLADAQVNEFVKEFRADVDRAVSDGNKTFETNLRKKYNFVDKATPNPSPEGGEQPKPTEGSTEALIAEAVAKALAPMQQAMATLNAKALSENRLQQLTEKLNGCKDDTFKQKSLKDFQRMTFENDEAFTEYLNETATDVEAVNQALADKGLASQGAPMFSQKGEDGVSAAVQSFVKAQSSDGNQFAGKEV